MGHIVTQVILYHMIRFEFHNNSPFQTCWITVLNIQCFLSKACLDGHYGLNCALKCVGRCKDHDLCNHTTGLCDNGCADGWTGGNCTDGCSEN